MRTTARRHDDTYVVHDGKTFISNGDVADVIVLFATLDPRLGKERITAFLIETARLKGFSAGSPRP